MMFYVHLQVGVVCYWIGSKEDTKLQTFVEVKRWALGQSYKTNLYLTKTKLVLNSLIGVTSI